MRNAYYNIDNNRSAYFLGNDGKAVRGIRQFTDAKGRKQIEAYNNQTMKQMRNVHYNIDGNRSAYFLGSNGKAITGLRKVGKTYEYYDNNFKQVRNKVVSINGNTAYRFQGNGLAKTDRFGYAANISNVYASGVRGFYNGGYSYPAGQCTAFVSHILADQGVNASQFKFLGNGAQWAGNARARGIKVDRTPKVGAIVGFGGGYGHVAYIKKVNANGTFVIAEGNYSGRAYNERTISMSTSGVNGIIHF